MQGASRGLPRAPYGYLLLDRPTPCRVSWRKSTEIRENNQLTAETTSDGLPFTFLRKTKSGRVAIPIFSAFGSADGCQRFAMRIRKIMQSRRCDAMKKQHGWFYHKNM